MKPNEDPIAFGAPGIEPRWTSSAKEGLGTAYHTSCRVWFTLSHGIVNEIYYPTVDQPNTRDLQFLISDGSTFCHEEKRDLEHKIEYPERDCVLYRITNSEPNGRYRLSKDILADPHRSVVLMHTQLEVVDKSLIGKLRLYVLLAPHLAREGAGNLGWCSEIGGNNLLHAQRKGIHLVMGCSGGFARRSIGYVGTSDGWQDLMKSFKMDWEFRSAGPGNLALTGEIVVQDGQPFTIAIALGHSCQSTVAKLLHSLAEPFKVHRAAYVRQWQRTVLKPKFDFSAHTADGGRLYRLSRCILLAHEDKTFQGALVASMRIPWGETKSDADLGGYHLVWTRDLVQSATALLAGGQTGTPVGALIWLAAIQGADGAFPQNSWIDGNAYWSVVQLDEIAAPILLAWRLRREGVSLGSFDPWVMILRAAAYLIRQGPVTAQERWEESAGYSPSTLATVIAGLICAAQFAKERHEEAIAGFILQYADSHMLNTCRSCAVLTMACVSIELSRPSSATSSIAPPIRTRCGALVIPSAACRTDEPCALSSWQTQPSCGPSTPGAAPTRQIRRRSEVSICGSPIFPPKTARRALPSNSRSIGKRPGAGRAGIIQSRSAKWRERHASGLGCPNGR